MSSRDGGGEAPSSFSMLWKNSSTLRRRPLARREDCEVCITAPLSLSLFKGAAEEPILPPLFFLFSPSLSLLEVQFSVGHRSGKRERRRRGFWGYVVCRPPLEGRRGFPSWKRSRGKRGGGGPGLELHTRLLCLRGRKGATTFAVLHHGMQHSFWGGSSHTGKTALFVSEFTPPHPSSVHTPTSVRAFIAQELFSPSPFLGVGD